MPSVNFGTHKLDMINLTLKIDIRLNLCNSFNFLTSQVKR